MAKPLTLEQMGRLHDKLRKREALAELRRSPAHLTVQLEAKRPAHNWKSRGPLFRAYPPEVKEAGHRWLAKLMESKAEKIAEMEKKGKRSNYIAVLVAVATQCALRECGKLPSFKELHIRKNKANRMLLAKKSRLGMRDYSDPSPAPQLYGPRSRGRRRTRLGGLASAPAIHPHHNQVSSTNMEGV